MGGAAVTQLDRSIRLVEKLVIWLAAAGACIILVQMVWISYGVFTRYALNVPDRMVTEATALLLFPVAFAGLAYALREDAYPRVTMLTDRLPATGRKIVALVNMTLMLGVGLFFATGGGQRHDPGLQLRLVRPRSCLWPRWIFLGAGGPRP